MFYFTSVFVAAVSIVFSSKCFGLKLSNDSALFLLSSINVGIGKADAYITSLYLQLRNSSSQT